jgi:hypothetical protein
MKKIVIACIFALAVPALAHAQATRTWVSGVGDDVNPCSRTAPCKTFAGAISKTAAGGEISVLDPGGYGAVTITKSITINGDGTLAGILAAGTNGIIVNAGVNDVVTIRSISINGAGTGLNGIRYLAGKQLTVDNVTIEGFTTRGIDMSLTNNGNLFVQDTTITRVPTGIRVATTVGQAVAILANVHLEGTTNGYDGAGNSFATISDSVISRNTGTGIVASAATAVVNVEGCVIAFNSVNGINASVSGSIIRVSDNSIFNNSTGITFVGGATVESPDNNRIAGNGASLVPNVVMTVN